LNNLRKENQGKTASLSAKFSHVWSQFGPPDYGAF